jgi:hypothetical protein
MRWFRHRMLPGLLLLLVAVAPAASNAQSVPFGQGLLWRVERSGAEASHIFGTFHSSDPSITALPAPVAGAFRGANSLVIEAVLDQAAARRATAMMVLPDGRSLDQIIGANLFARVAEIGTLYQLSTAELRRFEPWALATMFCLTPAEMRSDEPPLDQRLEREARAMRKAVHGLETIEEQFGLFEELPIESQRRLLESVVEFYPQMEAFTARMKQAYLDRDVAAIFALSQEASAGGDEVLMRWFEDKVMTERNHRMVERLRPRLAEGGAFVAVGALHLPGEEGILRLLERQGYRVTRLY